MDFSYQSQSRRRLNARRFRLKEKKAKSLCLICGEKGSSFLKVSNSQIFVSGTQTQLETFLYKVVGEHPFYSVSDSICSCCFDQLDQLDVYQTKVSQIRSYIISRYKNTKVELNGCHQRMTEILAASLANIKKFKHGTTLNVSSDLSVTVFHDSLPLKNDHNTIDFNRISDTESFLPSAFGVNGINYASNLSSQARSQLHKNRRNKLFRNDALNKQNFNSKKVNLKNCNINNSSCYSSKKLRLSKSPKLSPEKTSQHISLLPLNNNHIAYSHIMREISTQEGNELNCATKDSNNCHPTHTNLDSNDNNVVLDHINDSAAKDLFNVELDNDVINTSKSPNNNVFDEFSNDQNETISRLNSVKQQLQEDSNSHHDDSESDSSSSSSSGSSNSSSNSSTNDTSSESDANSDSDGEKSIENGKSEEGKVTESNGTAVKKEPCSDSIDSMPILDETPCLISPKKEQNEINASFTEDLSTALKQEESYNNNVENEVPSVGNNLINGSFASSILDTFLSTSLWMGNGDNGANPEDGYQPKKSDVYIDDHSISTDDKEKRLALKNTGKSYVNTKGKVIEAKRVQQQDCSRCHLKCNQRINEKERLLVFREFWDLGDYTIQREYLASHMEREFRVGRSGMTRTVVLYYLTSHGKRLQVCRQFYLKTLDVSEKASRIVLEKKIKGELGNPANINNATKGSST